MTLCSGKKLGEDLMSQGILDISNIPEETKLNDKQQIQKECVICRQPHIDTNEIKSFLKGLKYPLYFMDFETFATAIPIYDGTAPIRISHSSFRCMSSPSRERWWNTMSFWRKEKTIRDRHF